MQTFKDKQGDMFKFAHLPPRTLEWLESHWPGIWRREIIPMIDERLFSGLYCADDGRASKPTADMAGIMILKEMHDLTYDEAVENATLHTGWQYALDVAPSAGYVAVRTLKYFAAGIMESDCHRTAFEDMTKKIVEKLQIETGVQRMDSTHILSNMANLSRLGLFVKTTEAFLLELKKKQPKKYAGLDRALRARYVERKKGTFGDARGSEAKRRLSDCAEDINYLITRFNKSKNARKLRSFHLLKRLFAEQCRVEKEKVILREAKEISGASLQSPHDPDAGYSGHKGKGYQAQLSETCDPENETQVITHVEVESAAESDADALVPAVEMLEEKDLKPEKMLNDTAYCGGGNDVALRDKGVELVGPAPGREPGDDKPQPASFETTFDLKEVTACPAGVAPLRVSYDGDADKVSAVFDKEQCLACPSLKRCAVKRRAEGYVLTYERSRMAASRRRRFEETEGFKKEYAMRAGIEAANSELKRAHGMGRLRVRGQPAVEFAVFMKALACNVKRCVKALESRLRDGDSGHSMPVFAKNVFQNALWRVIHRVENYRLPITGINLRLAA